MTLMFTQFQMMLMARKMLRCVLSISVRTSHESRFWLGCAGIGSKMSSAEVPLDFEVPRKLHVLSSDVTLCGHDILMDEAS